MKHRSILLATDMSANAAFAARWARNYAQISGREVVLAHIIEINVPNWVHDAYSALEDEGRRAELEARVHEWYETHAHTRADEVLLDTGNIDQTLAEMAQKVDAGMIVLAKSGKSPLTKFLAGSTAQMMAANPPRPVAVIHPDHTTFDETTRIAVATDMTETADKAIVAAASLARKLGAHLHIVHSSKITSPSLVDEDSMLDLLSPEALIGAAEEKMEEVLDDHIEHLQDLPHTAHVLDKHPVEAIGQFAEERAIDIVFVGNAARYNVVTNVFGRVSVKLMQALDCSFIVVPPHTDFDELEDDEQE